MKCKLSKSDWMASLLMFLKFGSSYSAESDTEGPRQILNC